MHIGLIGGIGPAATEFYYRSLVKRYADAGRKMELTIVHADVDEVVANFKKGDRAAQAAIFLKFAKRLQAASCDMATITSMAGHFCVQELAALSPLPVLNAIPSINARFERDSIKKIGLLGTNGVMASKLYGGITSAEVLVPQDNVFEKVSDDYFAIAGNGVCTEAQRTVFFEAGHEMISRGADAIMLAGTDLCLAFDGLDPGFPVIDSALVHVDAIFDASMAE